MTIREDIELAEQGRTEVGGFTEKDIIELQKNLTEAEIEIENLQDDKDELKEELKDSKRISWRDDPDPYGYHGIPIVTRLEEMGYLI